MKKICLLVITFILLFTVQSCKFENQYETYEDGIYISLNEELLDYMVYRDQLPKLHFDMNNVNVSTSSTNASVLFVSNDFYEISDAWGKHLSRYDSNEMVIISAAEQTIDEGEAKFGGEYLKLDAVDENGKEQKYSVEYRIACWDKDGTRYSYQYRTFVSGGKRYYVYCYTNSLTITMEQPLMIVKVNGKQKLLLVPLPYDTKYEVSGSSLTIEALTEKDTYLSSRYRKYIYPSSLSHLSLEEQIAEVKKWYIKYCNGVQVEDEFFIEYCGAEFKVNFNSSRKDNTTGEDKPAFELIYIPDIVG